jgi:hypothetical protein
MSIQVITKENRFAQLTQLQPEVNSGLEELGALIYGEAYDNTPEQTGAMKDSLFTEVTKEGELTTGYGVEYAPDVELGTAHQAAQPALLPAFDHYATEAGLGEVVARAIQNAVGGGG